ncbi:phage regulatory CII family protein [Paralcaligenes ginsengisoli]
MTSRYSGADWRDVLYNSIRATPGGLADAAQFLTVRRGKTIHPETLRTRLRHVDGESISLEMVELLTEWMQEKVQAQALEWLDALNAQYGRIIATQPADETDASSIQAKALSIARQVGALAGTVADAEADMVITPREADDIAALCRDLMRMAAALMASSLAAARPK